MVNEKNRKGFVTGKLAIVYSDDYQKYYFGPDHLQGRRGSL